MRKFRIAGWDEPEAQTMKLLLCIQILTFFFVSLNLSAQSPSDSKEKTHDIFTPFKVKSAGLSIKEISAENMLQCELQKSDLIKFLESFDVKSCFPMKELDRGLHRSPLEADMAVCSCIEGKVDKNKILRHSTVLQKYIPSSDKTVARDALKTYEENFKSAWKKIESERLGAAINASIVFDGDVNLTSFFKKDETILEKMKEKLLSGVTSGKSTHISQEIKKIHDRIAVSKENDLLVGNKDFIPNQCVSPREFLAYNQLPKDPVLTKILKDGFNPIDWNYDELKKKYSTLIVQSRIRPYPPRLLLSISETKEKLLFLSRNPLIKAAMASAPDDKKIKLYKILQEYSLPCTVNCSDKNNNDKIYRKSLKNYFADKDVIFPMSKDADSRWKELVESNRNSPKLFMNNMDAPSRKIMRETFIADSGDSKNDPDSCDLGDKGFDEKRCLETYSSYCDRVKHNFDKLVQDSDSESSLDNLDYLISKESNLDFSKNISFKEFNATMCEREYPTRPGEKDTVSFNDFREKTCKNESLPKCRQEFSKKYKDVIIDEFSDFVTFISDIPVKNMSIADANAVANSSQDIKKVRKKIQNDFSAFFKHDGSFQDSDIQPVVSGATPSVQSENNSASSTFVSEPNAINNVNTYSGNFSTAQNVESPVKELADIPREDLEEQFSKWSKEVKDLRNEKESATTKGASSDYIKSLEDRNKALEMLIGQKDLNESQSEMLRKALKNEEIANSKLAKLEREIEKETEVKRRVESATFASQRNSFVDDQPMNRGPASARSTGGYQGASNSGGESPGIRPAEASSTVSRQEAARNRDSLAREEAKLVNVRQETSGTITIENLRGPASTGANAIAINITDEFYKQVRNNLVGLNLKQIEGSIPKDQIALLEKKGEITLILRNGENPPVEVKVARQDGSLVQVAKSTAKVVRESSLESLKNTLNLQNL